MYSYDTWGKKSLAQRRYIVRFPISHRVPLQVSSIVLDMEITRDLAINKQSRPIETRVSRTILAGISRDKLESHQDGKWMYISKELYAGINLSGMYQVRERRR